MEPCVAPGRNRLVAPFRVAASWLSKPFFRWPWSHHLVLIVPQTVQRPQSIPENSRGWQVANKLSSFDFGGLSGSGGHAYVFNAYDIHASAYVGKAEMETICEALGLETVPPIGEVTLPATMDETLRMAEGESRLSPSIEREGLVWVCGVGCHFASLPR